MIDDDKLGNFKFHSELGIHFKSFKCATLSKYLRFSYETRQNQTLCRVSIFKPSTPPLFLTVLYLATVRMYSGFMNKNTWQMMMLAIYTYVHTYS